MVSYGYAPQKSIPGHTENTFWYVIYPIAALRIFIESGIDVVILEVGVGGRLDATNCVTPQVCGITSLGMDHMEMLGDTLPVGVFSPRV